MEVVNKCSIEVRCCQSDSMPTFFLKVETSGKVAKSAGELSNIQRQDIKDARKGAGRYKLAEDESHSSEGGRGAKTQNFPGSSFLRAKTFQTKCAKPFLKTRLKSVFLPL